MNKYIIHSNPIQSGDLTGAVTTSRESLLSPGLARARRFIAEWKPKELSAWIYHFELDLDLSSFLDLIHPEFCAGLDLYIISWKDGAPPVCGLADQKWLPTYWAYGSKVLRNHLPVSDTVEIDAALTSGPLPPCWEPGADCAA